MKDVLEGVREASETERVFVDLYLKDYIKVRLTDQFLIKVTEDLTKFLNSVGKNYVQVHVKYEKVLALIYSYAAIYLKNGGLPMDCKMITSSKLLQIDFSDAKLQLYVKDLYLGSLVDEFLKKTSLDREGEELKSWVKGVCLFYVELLKKMIKYFRPILESRILFSCAALSPKSVAEMTTEKLASKWKYLAQKFPSVIAEREVPILLVEVKLLKTINLDGVKRPETFMARLQDFEDDDGDRIFMKVTRLGKALITIYNSSSAAERDFSLQVR